MSESPLVDLQWDDDSEDQFKRSWDFVRADGSPIDTLEEMEDVLGRPKADIARDLIRLPFGKAAPRPLIDEALAHASG